MLLPSALPCEGHRPPQPAATPAVRRSHRPVVSPSPYHSPPPEPALHSSTSLVAATTTGLLSTCHRLHQILSVSRASPSPAPAPAAVLAPAPANRVQKSSAPPSTALTRLPPPPRRSNKRTRAAAFASSPEPHEAVASDSENSDANMGRNAFATPRRPKRVRLTTPPPAPDRGARRGNPQEEEDEVAVAAAGWSDAEDRLLVEMVLRKLRLSKGDWDECARRLGKPDAKTVGRRWEGLVGSVMLRKEREKGKGRKRA